MPVVAALVLVAAILLAVAALRAAAPAQISGAYATAIEACRPPASAEKAGATLVFDWRVALQEEGPDATALLLLSGTDQMLCLADRGQDGRYSGSVSSTGRLDAATPGTLTFDADLYSARSRTAQPVVPPIRLVAGRVPDAAARLLVTAEGGAIQEATVRNGHYLGWLVTNAKVIRIAALDVGGNELTALADPDGL